ncbi:hypothetical protein Pyn_22522 [Prunus yedoensis var. nudiflora]|uniref:Pentatricopeptide repeat-containing protein n=1 Tax=Prunus yedoensis var. nudiflora TaxID=2094558 RepID=A0A314ZGH6_PRUYE|nr:hypothetical protein Pyn_22522 [Prunus yedoensis var. nudiflora]
MWHQSITWFDHYNTVIDGLAKQGCMEKAMGLYGQMVENGIIPDEITHRSLVGGFCGVNLVEEAVLILKEMHKRGHPVRNISYKFVIHGLCRNNRVDVAIQVLEMMISNRCMPDGAIYSTIIEGVAAAVIQRG